MEQLNHIDRMTVVMIIMFVAFACIVIFSIWPVNHFKRNKRYDELKRPYAELKEQFKDDKIRYDKSGAMYRKIKTKE